MKLLESPHLTFAADSADGLAEAFAQSGYVLVRGLLSDQVEAMREHFAAIHRDGRPGHYEPDRMAADPLDRYPRIMQPHRWDARSRQWLVEPRVLAVLAHIFGEPALAAQSMFYFKPPGGRGQTLHQDQFYLQVHPGTCVAAWTPLDDVDRANGGLVVVPHTADAEIDCSGLGRPGSYDRGGHSIPIPAGLKAVDVEMEAGDTLFFNGSLIHGSGPNRTTDRWRRTFIGHYVGQSCVKLAKHYHPLVDAAGRDTTREITLDGGPCGLEVLSAH